MIATENLLIAGERTLAKEETSPILNYSNVKKATLILRALNHKLRQQILKIIAEENRLTVTDVYIKLRIEQSVASQHLAILRKTGIVKTEREGRFIYYAIDFECIQAIDKFIYQLLL